MKYGYCRVSSKDQNLDRQLIAMKNEGVLEENIYTDKQSGKDFNRAAYKELINKLQEGDIVYFLSIDRLGRNYEEIIEQWHMITKEINADIIVLDMPLLNTTKKGNDLTGMPIITIEHIEETKEEKEEDNTMKERTRTAEEIKEEIKTYFEENEEEYNQVIEDLDSYNGYLGDDRYYNMYELDELLTGLTPTEVLERTFYGGDDDTKDANGTRGEFNPNREYFYYNGYGNLCSTDYKDYTCHLDNYFIENLIENAGQLYEIPEEVKELIEELENIEE